MAQGNRAVNTALIELAKGIARAHILDPALVCAIIEQESSWNQWALRYEPAFYLKYEVPIANLSPTESRARSFSWGLMQLMGQVSRELGFTGDIPNLCDPATGIEWGCRHLRNKLIEAQDNQHAALLLWNGGGNPGYANQVQVRMKAYQ